MSCQQATRFITSSNNNTLNHCNDLSNSNNHNISSNIIKENRITRVVQQEDPYVFTESVPTTPPILFNTQKTRTRLNDLTATTNTLSVGKLQQQQQQQKLPLTETNGKITATSNVIKTQASLLATTATTTTTPTTIKNVTQSLTTTTQLLSTTTAANNKKLTNVCIVRPQLQQQQPQHYHQQHLITSAAYEGDLKSISPPPLYTPPTPSLWQTPLLLETTTAAAVAAPITTPQTTATTTPQVANVAPQPPSVATSLQNSSIMVGCVTPTKQNVGGNTTTTTTTLMNSSLTTTTTNTTTAMAKVAPIIVHNNTPLTPTTPAPLLSPSSLDLDCSLQNLNQCLPPSKFHNHTLAQHLQKVECLKKSKKLNQLPDNLLQNDNGKVITISTSPLHTHPQQTTLSIPTSAAAAAAATLQTINCTSSSGGGSPVKHSDSEDLNEIPVNVIFRMALVPQHQPHHENEKSSNNMKLLTPAKNISTTTAITALPPPPPPPPQPQQIKINLNKNRTIPASKIQNQMVKQPQNNMSSIQQQQEQQQPQQEQQFPQFQRPLTIKKDILNLPLETVEKSLISTKKLTHTTSSSSKSTSRKLHTSFTNLVGDLPYNWQLAVGGGAGDCSTTKGAVAIIKLSQHNLDLDTSPLSTAAGLPYCLQQHWFNSYDFHKSSELLAKKPINRSLAREERIALYKQQLRIQAMQLLSTRSLQKLPLKVARRRLLCVDRLIRKYQQNENELPANVKRCCFNGCDAYTLEMASHCQKHIVYNAAQHVFLPCTAKFADNTQCRVPVFDITHDLPLCIEHARKRDAYNRLLYEQRPRKISAPTSILLNETVVMSSSSKLAAIAGGVGGSGGLIIKTQNYQLQQQHQQTKQKQQQHQQQLVANKRPTLVNQQPARKRKMNAGGGVSNPVGRPQKRVKKNLEITNVKTTTATINRNHQQQQQMPRLTATNLKRKSSTTSLESIATSNSQHSTTSSTSQQLQQQQQHQQQHQQLYGLTSSVATATTTTTSSLSAAATSLPPPALAPLSSGVATGGGGLMVGHHGLPQHLFSFGHDNHPHHHPNLNNINNDKHSFSSTGSVSSTTPTELKDFMSQFSFIAHRNQHSSAEITNTTDVNLLNTNSNSNFTSSGMGSTTSLPTADDFLTQDMLSICENSSASSADTGLGGLSDPELMLGGPEDDIPLGDTHLLEEHDLANVLNSLPEDAFKELFATVHQDESDEIERAIELADKHLKTLQQTIGSELGDFLDFNDDMLMDNSDMCNTSTVSANSILDTSALFMGAGNGGGGAVSANATTLGLGGGATVAGNGGGLVQT